MDRETEKWGRERKIVRKGESVTDMEIGQEHKEKLRKREEGDGETKREREGERTNKFRHGKDRLIQNDQQETNQKKQTKRLNLLERHREKQERKRNGC